MLFEAGAKSVAFPKRVRDLLERVQYKRADTEAELDEILRLRYDAFIREGQIAPRASRRLEDSFDHTDNVYNFGVFMDEELAGALRIHALTQPDQKSPALEGFGEFLSPELNAGKVVVDPNRFVANYRLARQYPELPFLTVRVGFLAAAHFGANLMTMTVRAEHQAFYRKHFFAYVVCAPRPYPLVTKPISLMFMDFMKVKQHVLELHPYWSSSKVERECLFGKHPTLLRSLTESTAGRISDMITAAHGIFA